MHNKRNVAAAFSAIERESGTEMILAINENKTKYMLSTSRDVRRITSEITVSDGHLMLGSGEVGEEDDLISIGRTISMKPCHQLL